MTRDDLSAAQRKEYPLARGLFAYFPDALMEVAKLSKTSNDQHNPGEPMHWARDKSTDHADCLLRHQIDAGKRDTDGERHSTKVAWRALAQLQLEIEADNAADLPGAKTTMAPNPQFRKGDWVALVDDEGLLVATGHKAEVISAMSHVLDICWEKPCRADDGWYASYRFRLTSPPIDDPQF